MTGPEQAARTHAVKRLVMVVAGGIAGIAVALAAVYGINTIQRNAGDAACAGAAALAQRLAPLAHGEVAAFAVADQPVRLPDLAFRDAGGAERHLADWRGRTVLLNLWATWCVPCRKEMPALDRLQREMGSDTFQVVAVSVDRTGLPGAKKFLADTGAETLALYADPTARMGVALRAAGLPATLLLDRQGREIGRLLGPAEWDGEDAKRLIAAAMK